MALTVPETIGFCEEVAQFMTVNAASLQAKGLNVNTWISELNAQSADLVVKNDTQEATKADTGQNSVCQIHHIAINCSKERGLIRSPQA